MMPRTIDTHGSGMPDALVDDVVADVLVVGDVLGGVSISEVAVAELCTETD